jgi:hypothetical protein
MKENNVLALIVAYYLSKYDKVAYESLNFQSSNEAHKRIGQTLGVNYNSVKNMRDEFDPIHDNPRVGWYQRPLRSSRIKVVELFQNMSQVELRDVVLGVLNNPEFSSRDLSEVIDSISKNETKANQGKLNFIIRGPTGRKAEEIFIEYHRANGIPISGKLLDKRDYGCGYDFEIVNAHRKAQVEVKGLDGKTGGVLFTSKEWELAKLNGDSYYLVIVRNVSDSPTIQIINNPASVLNPKKSVFTTVQVRWSVSDRELPI